MHFNHHWCALLCIWHLQKVFDIRVVISFLLNQRGAVQLTRTKSVHTRKTFIKKNKNRKTWKFNGFRDILCETLCMAACEAADWSECRLSSSLASDHLTSSSLLSELCEGDIRMHEE